MLKFKDKKGNVVGVLKDEDNMPEMVSGDILPEIKDKKEESKEQEETTKEEE